VSVLLAAAEWWSGADPVGAVVALLVALWPFLMPLAGLGMVVGGLALLRTDGAG
jgi:hypothetical protein